MERRFAALDAVAGRTLGGVLMRYGEPAHIGNGVRERFLPGAFGNVGALDIVCNFQHDRTRPLCRTNGGGLELRDGDDALRLSATLPETRDGDDALALAGKVLRGWSVEFAPIAERANRDGERIIERAKLLGVALVDSPAYAGSVVVAERWQRPPQPRTVVFHL